MVATHDNSTTTGYRHPPQGPFGLWPWGNNTQTTATSGQECEAWKTSKIVAYFPPPKPSRAERIESLWRDHEPEPPAPMVIDPTPSHVAAARPWALPAVASSLRSKVRRSGRVAYWAR